MWNSRAARGLAAGVLTLAVCLACMSEVASAHGVSQKDASFVESIDGAAIGPFLYLGAKHMVTGYDHLLFLVGVISSWFARAPTRRSRARSGATP